MELVRKTRRRVVELRGYNGVCEKCVSPVTYSESFTAIELYKDDVYALVIPADAFACPYCDEPMGIARIWMNLEVSVEFDNVERTEE